MNAVKPRSVLVHGRSVNCVEAGSGPVLLLIHGMAGNIGNWQEVIGPLARHHTVVAPDLPGHGASAPGAGDYSLGALAAGLRDLLVVLGHERATLVGHSLGGGIAMQFAYQFPEITERLVLVSSGGLGPEVSPVLRAAALPGADLFIAATAAAGRSVGAALARGLAAAGLRPTADIAEVARGYASLADPGRRAAFLATLRSVIGVGGQRVYAGDRLDLAEGMPVLIMWGRVTRSSPSAMASTPTRPSRAAAWRSSTGLATCRSSKHRGSSSQRSSDSSRRPSCAVRRQTMACPLPVCRRRGLEGADARAGDGVRGLLPPCGVPKTGHRQLTCGFSSRCGRVTGSIAGL